MKQGKASGRTIFSLTLAVLAVFAALAVGSPAQLNAAAHNRPLIETSFDDQQWKGMQAATRPWTREEMMSAVPADLPGVNEQTLQRWAAEELSGSVYNTAGGPGVIPGGGPAGQVNKMAAAEVEVAGGTGPIDPLGYSYPAPFTRYEAFPSFTIYPYKTVGKVFFTEPGIGNFVCSASSIGGDGVITAAHCVHDSATGTFWSNWVFVPAYRDGVAPYGQWTANHLWFLSAYQDGGNGDSRFDIGGAVLNRKGTTKISASVGFLGFQWNQTTTATSAHWAILGYPQAAPFNGNRLQICQASFAYTAGGSAPSPIGAGCDQTGGTSGGPWIRSFSGNAGATNYANGVNSYRRCFDQACTSVYTFELFSPYFDNSAKALRDCIVNSVPGNPANPALNCAPGT